jgi:hypothetical protein
VFDAATSRFGETPHAPEFLGCVKKAVKSVTNKMEGVGMRIDFDNTNLYP